MCTGVKGRDRICVLEEKGREEEGMYWGQPRDRDNVCTGEQGENESVIGENG